MKFRTHFALATKAEDIFKLVQRQTNERQLRTRQHIIRLQGIMI